MGEKYVCIQNLFFPQELSIPAEVDLRVRVAVVEDHGEELGGWLQGGLLVHLGKQFLLAHEQNQSFGDKKKLHLKADGATVGEIASGGIELAHRAHLKMKMFPKEL